MNKNSYIGSALDDWLEEEEMLVETKSTARARVIAWLFSVGNGYEEAQQDSDDKTDED